MKALGVIAGMLAGLSVAHAAERDDLLSVFKTVCMDPKLFMEAMRDFGHKRGWKVDIKPLTVTGPDAVAQAARYPKISGSAFPPDFRSRRENGDAVTVFVSVDEGFQGRKLDRCTVHQDGRRMFSLARRVPSTLRLSVPLQALPQDVRMSFGKEGPDTQSKVWSLSSDGWDYIILDETTHMRLQPSTYLTRVKSIN
jgi:hypothetical protein